MELILIPGRSPPVIHKCMSRSIHVTRRTLAEIRRTDYADPDQKREVLQRARRQWRRKQAIKDFMREERRQPATPPGDASPAILPIEVLDEGPHVFHAATPEDIRAVLARLPGAAVEGISRLQLSLGSAYQAESREGNGYEEFDPYTGRLSSELFPGVYSGDILGTYTPDSGLVEIYACVCDWTKCPLPKAIGELFLKLAALKTLVHEAAHHHDWTARVGRGRWFPGTKDQRERYAGKMEREWTRDTVVPYLEATYPEAVAALLRLLDERGGLAVTLTTLAAGYFSGNWLCDLLTHESLLESRLALARRTHFSDEYELCLLITGRILSEDPAHHEAKILRADTLGHMERYDEGLALIEEVLQEASADHEAHYTKILLLSGAKNWESVLQHSAIWESACGSSPKDAESFHWYRALARAALGQHELLEQDLTALEKEEGRHGRSVDTVRPEFWRAFKNWTSHD